MRFFNAYRVVNRTAVSPVNQTSLLVAGASRLGLPVSTTHVAVGALFGIGLINGTARARTILTIADGLGHDPTHQAALFAS